MRAIVVLVAVASCGDNHQRPAGDASPVAVDAVVDAVADATLDSGASCACDDGDPCTNDTCVAGACANVHVERCAVPQASTQPIPSGSSCIASTCAIPDRDGDGLNDAWEIAGYIDIDCNGADDGPGVDLALPGADPDVRDVYLEIDVMVATDHDHALAPATLPALVDAFARRGVVLHVDPVHDQILEVTVVTFAPIDPSCTGPSAASFADLKAMYSAAQRRLAYHYAIAGHYNTCASLETCAACPLESGSPAVLGATGRAELPGNDFILSLGAFSELGLVPTVEQEAGVLMHELGHNFGLRHGGDDDIEFKPNYLSVVNSTFTFTGIPVADGIGSTVAKPCSTAADCPGGLCTGAGTCARLDFSGAALAPLDEGALDEAVGIAAGTDDITTYNCPDLTPLPGAGAGPIDWNCVAPATESAVIADINADGTIGVLAGRDDWATLRRAFQCTPAGSASSPMPSAMSSREPPPPLPSARGSATRSGATSSSRAPSARPPVLSPSVPARSRPTSRRRARRPGEAAWHGPRSGSRSSRRESCEPRYRRCPAQVS